MANHFKYKIVLTWSEEDQAFIAEVPELPGCAVEGASYQEVVDNIEVLMPSALRLPAWRFGVSTRSVKAVSLGIKTNAAEQSRANAFFNQ
jgi:hypothetical protein